MCTVKSLDANYSISTCVALALSWGCKFLVMTKGHNGASIYTQQSPSDSITEVSETAVYLEVFFNF